jgi:uncharacterized DUF497 family protein
LPFDLAGIFDWETALYAVSERKGERRIVAYGMLQEKLHVIVFTRDGFLMRVISLRRANRKEAKLYEEARSRDDR